MAACTTTASAAHHAHHTPLHVATPHAGADQNGGCEAGRTQHLRSDQCTSCEEHEDNCQNGAVPAAHGAQLQQLQDQPQQPAAAAAAAAAAAKKEADDKKLLPTSVAVARTSLAGPSETEIPLLRAHGTPSGIVVMEPQGTAHATHATRARTRRTDTTLILRPPARTALQRFLTPPCDPTCHATLRLTQAQQPFGDG